MAMGGCKGVWEVLLLSGGVTVLRDVGKMLERYGRKCDSHQRNSKGITKVVQLMERCGGHRGM